MEKLTLQINKKNFLAIMKGEQKAEHRYVYPGNQKKYVRFKCDGKVYDSQDDIPDGELDIEVLPIEYDALCLINGRRKDAPRLTVEVERVEFIIFTDENGNDIIYKENGIEYVGCQIWYHLGKILDTENVQLKYLVKSKRELTKSRDLAVI